MVETFSFVLLRFDLLFKSFDWKLLASVEGFSLKMKQLFELVGVGNFLGGPPVKEGFLEMKHSPVVGI